MIRIIIALVSLSVWCSLASDWYVRPCVYTSLDGSGKPIPTAGVYGAQDGTSYANAWNGLCAVIWGSGGVVAGDTLWVCGCHIHSTTSNNYISSQAQVVVGAQGSAGNPITIRMDYSPDPGEVYGCFNDLREPTWYGPDANGVYFRTGATINWLYEPHFQLFGTLTAGGTNMYTLHPTNVTTWSGANGTYCIKADTSFECTNFVKTATGEAPATNIFSTDFGYNFFLGTNSWITFANCRFLDLRSLLTIP